MQIAVRGPQDDSTLLRAVELAFARIDAFHRAMSFHAADSDLAAIAAAPAGARLTVSADTWRVLASAIAVERDSDGDFNAAVAPQLVSSGLLPAPLAHVDRRRLAPSLADGIRLEESGRVRVLRPVWIDLGGIAKGAAVDAAIDALMRRGVDDAVVDAGGDIAVRGSLDQPIRVRLPWPGQGAVAAGSLGDGAIATSAPPGGGGPSPLVVAVGKEAVWRDRSVSVLAPTCLIADALTKVLAIRGPSAAPILASLGARGFSVDAVGRIEHVC